MRITQAEFWKLLPFALERLAAYYRFEESFHSWKIEVKAYTVSGRANPAPGEEIRYTLQSHRDRYVYDPLAAVAWLLTGTYIGLSKPDRADGIGLDRRFIRKVEDATLQRPGFSREIRAKLLAACKVSETYLEPTTK